MLFRSLWAWIAVRSCCDESRQNMDQQRHGVARSCISLSILILLSLSIAENAQAYSGPGSGISFLGALISAVAGFFLIVVAILAWPFRVWWRRRKHAAQQKRLAKDPQSVTDETTNS